MDAPFGARERQPTEPDARVLPLCDSTPSGQRSSVPSTVARSLAHLPAPYVLALAAFAISLAAFLLEERVQVNGGQGWDGIVYTEWAKHFRRDVLVRGVNLYYIQRILPSATVH